MFLFEKISFYQRRINIRPKHSYCSKDIVNIGLLPINLLFSVAVIFFFENVVLSLFGYTILDPYIVSDSKSPEEKGTLL